VILLLALFQSLSRREPALHNAPVIMKHGNNTAEE